MMHGRPGRQSRGAPPRSRGPLEESLATAVSPAPKRIPADLDRQPIVVAWETTRACAHCRADARLLPQPGQLDEGEALDLVDGPDAFEGSILVLTGGGALASLRRAGLGQVALSVDGANAASHGGLRALPGFFDSPLFRSLRGPARLRGRRRACEHATVCGVSRARAFALGGDPLGEDPTCIHRPEAAC